MKSPLISVIVPVYNVESYLDRCVESIVNQTFTDIEILLIDDGSTDNSGKMCDAWGEKDGRIRVIHKPNGGQSDARNLGTVESAGQYINYIDSDDYIEPTMLEVLYNLLIENNADISACGINNSYETGCYPQCEVLQTFQCSGVEALKETLIGTRSPGGIVNKLFRREIMEKHKFIVGKTYEDAFITPDVLLDAEKVAITTEPLYHYWHRSGSTTTEPFNIKAMDVIDSYLYTLDVVKTKCPEILDVANFRVQWAHFVVLDRMLQTENFRKLPQYADVVKFLKKNWRSVFKSSYFRKGRRISALALKINVRLYVLLAKVQAKRIKEHG